MYNTSLDLVHVPTTRLLYRAVLDLVKLFSEDEIEQERISWEHFPQGSRGNKEYFNQERYDTAFAALRKNRATGFDAIELEAYAASPELKQELYFLTHALYKVMKLTSTTDLCGHRILG